MHQHDIRTALTYEVFAPTHFCFNLQVMRADPRHRGLVESLDVQQPGGARPVLRESTDASGNRFLRFDAQPGSVVVDYRAQLQLLPAEWPQTLPENSVTELPDDVLPYLMPSRYCESDVMSRAAQQLFGQVPMGTQRVEAIIAWIQSNIQYTIGTTTAMTSAKQVFVQRAGVCRDFAHLGITFCRALNIPARLVVGYTYFDEPPQDFHALFEAWLGGRWVMFDPTGLADPRHLVRVGQGSDAKDVAFLTAFGSLRMSAMRIDLDEVEVATGRRRFSKPEEAPVLGAVLQAPLAPA